MGYYTRYELDAIGPTETIFDYMKVIASFRERFKYAAYAIDEYGECLDDTKWYSSVEDLTKFSNDWPDWEFQLTGYGEENGDVWKKIIKDGKVIKSFRGVIKFVEEDE